jgi:hypothetical protein
VRAVSEPTSIRRGRAGCYSETHGPARKFLFFYFSIFSYFLILSISTGGAKGNLLLIYTLVNGGQVGGGMEKPNHPPTKKKKKKKKRMKRLRVVLVGPGRTEKIREPTGTHGKGHPHDAMEARASSCLFFLFRAWVL